MARFHEFMDGIDCKVWIDLDEVVGVTWNPNNRDLRVRLRSGHDHAINAADGQELFNALGITTAVKIPARPAGG